MTDDTGFGASSIFGGPIPTPALDRIAQRGLRYNNSHNDGVIPTAAGPPITESTNGMASQGRTTKPCGLKIPGMTPRGGAVWSPANATR